MRSVAAVLLALPLVALAGSHSHRRHHPVKARDVQHVRRGANYTLVDDYSGQSFFDNWTFFTDPDPTSGLVTYLGKDDATSKGLAFVQQDGTIKLGVDSTTQLQPGQPRNSVRIQTNKVYNGGLFIADIYAMAHGCSVWPAYWSVGADWPNQGEIDIIEGVNLNTDNQITLHTGPTCTITNAIESMTGHLQGNTCTSSNGNNAGCAVTQNGSNSFGHPFNEQGGGVFAHLWDSTGITVWFFPRSQIPQDIQSSTPDPTSWGTPTALFPNNDSCNTAEHFTDHQLVIDTTLCGDWAGAAFSGDGCPGTCQDYVANATNFQFAQWAIKSIRVYQLAGSQ